MKDFFKKYKAKLITGLAVLALGAAVYFNGGTVDWGKLLADASKGEVTDTAQKLEDIKPVEE